MCIRDRLWITLTTLPCPSATTKPVVSPSGSPHVCACALRGSKIARRRAAYSFVKSSVMGRGGHPAIAVRVGDLHRFGQEVEMLDRVDGPRRQIEAFEDVEPEERGHALGGRRRLVHGVAAVRGGD